MEDIFSQSSDELIDNNANPPEGLPDGVYTYPGVDALYKKENGQWYKKIGQANYAPLRSGNVNERVKMLEEKAVQIPEDKRLIERYTNIQDIDVNQPVKQYKDVFEEKENTLVKKAEPVKKADEYKIDENNGVQTWQKKKEVKIQETIDPKTGQPMGMSYVNVYEDITDPVKVAELNKKNEVQASTSKEQQIFTGYPDKKGSEYRINDDNLWEVNRPGSNEFLTIVDPKSVSALNSYFKQNAEVFDDKKAEEIKRKNDYINNFNVRLNKVNKNIIGGSEEGAVETLSKLFPEFKFEEMGMMTDNIKVSKLKNGVVVASDEISLDNFFDDADNLNAQRLREWLRTNVISDLNNSYKAYNEAAASLEKRISETIYEQDPEISKVVSDATSVDNTILNEQIRRSVSSLSSTFFPEETKKVEEAGAQLTKDYARVVRDTYARVKDKSKEEQATAFMAIKTDDIVINAANNYSNDVKDNYNTFVSQQKNFKSYVDDIDAKVKSGEISQEEYENNYKQKIKDGAADIEMKAEKLKEDLVSLDYYIRGSEKAIASNLIIKEMTGTTAGAFGRSIVDGAMSIPTFIAGMNKEERKKFTDSIVGVGTTDEYMQSDNRYDLTKAAFQMTRSLSAMAVGRIGAAALGLPAVAGGYVSLFAMGYNEMKDSLDGIGDISSEDKVIMSSLYALGSAALENYGLGFLLTKSVAKKSATNWILKNAFSQIAKNASKEMVEAQIMNSAKLYASKIAIETGGGMFVEGVVEGSQAGAQKLVQEAYDQIKGTKYFNNESAYEIVGDVLQEAYYGAIGAMSVMSVTQSADVLSRGVNVLKNKDQINLLITSADLEGMDQALLTNLKASILSGKISKDEAKEIVDSFQEIKGKVKSMPDDMSIDNKSVALDLMIERDKLNKKIEGKDPFLVVKEKERIGQINEQLKNLGNAVQEPSTEGVLQREQEGVTETGSERGGMEQIVQGKEVTREGEATQKEVVPGATAKIADVDIVYPTEPQAEERKAFRSTSEYVENASKELPVEDVEAFTKELDGDFGLLTAENPMAQPLTEEENKQLNQKAEEWLTGRGYKPRRVTGKYGQAENSFFVPNLTRQDAIDFAKQFNQEAVAHSDGLVYQDGSMNPRVKADDNLSFTESYSPDSDFVSVVNTKDGLKTFSIGYNFDQKVMPEQQAATQISEVTITPETSQTVTERINKETDTKRKKVFTAVQKVLSAIPNSRIILHDNVDAFVAGVAKSAGITNDEAISQGVNNNRGSYVNGDIHINLETAGVTTVFHEAFHDLLAKKGMENNALLDMAKGLKSVISDKALKTRLDDFVSNYEQGERAEEYTTELGAIMAEAQKELSTTKFQQFKTLVNKIAKKLGMPVVFSAASTAQDAVDFMNSMSGKLGKGEQIEVGEAKGKTGIKAQTEKLFLEEAPKFKSLDDISKYIQSWVDKNKLFDKSIEQVSDQEVVDKFAEHILSEIKAWESIKGSDYVGFYDEDIPQRLNPELQKFAKERYGRELNDEEVSLYHIVSAFASPSADPQFDSSKGLEVFDKYMMTGELTAYGTEQATIWDTDSKGKRYDTGKLKFDENGNPVYKQVAKAYATTSLEKFNNIVNHFKGDVSKAVNWVLSNHSFEEASKMMGKPTTGPKANQLDDNEYFTKENGGNGVFAITGAKLGSYILNRVGNYSTVTKDMWYARTLARLAGESLTEKGKAIKSPWASNTKEGLRKRKLADKAFQIVAKELGTSPADVQQKIWDFEKRLYEKLGAVEKASYASEGLKSKAKEILSQQPPSNAKKIKAQRTAPGNKLFNEPLKDAETIAKSYMKSVGMDYVPVEKITKLDENLSKRISDAYDKMKNDPNDLKVKAAYEAMAKETLEQHKAIIDKGYKVEINNTEPYSDSGAMIEDLRDNKRMKIFSTESGFGDEPITDEQRKENPLLRDSGFKDVNGETLLVNDVFRFVHDFFGHAKLGNGFGPIGEENAWRVHSEMYSPEARKAMTSETRGQNSWVNFSGVNDAVFKKRDKARQLRKEGKIEEANQMVGEVYEEMSFADQKVGLLPDFAFEEGRPSKIKAQKPSKQEIEATAKALEGLDVNKILRESSLINSNERTSFTKYNKTYSVGNIIDGNKLEELSGDLVGSEPNKKFVLVQAPLSNFKEENRESLLEEYEEYEKEDEIYRLESIKIDFEKTPPIPMVGDGFHRIVAAKELGHKTILMWQEISPKSISEAYHKAKADESNPNLVNAVEKLLGKPNDTKQIKAQKQSKEDAIQDAKDIHEKSFKRFKDLKRAIANAVNNLEKSDWYRDSDDTQREEAIREIKEFFGEKIKKAPSVAKVMGKTKQTAFVSDLAAAIRDQVKLQARSSRETAKNINDRRKALGLAIKQVVSQYKGKITERQLKSINTRIANVNLFNQEMVDRVISYVDKVMNNAEYATKINNAFAERRAIRRMMKSGNMAETVAVAKEFTQIDPSMVDDIDTYLEMAQKIRGAVKSSKRVKDSVSLKEIVNFGEAYEYINPVLKAQEESMKNMLLAEHNDLVEAGVISNNMTLKDINNIIKNIRVPKDEEVTAEEEETAREFLKQRLESIKSIISMVAKGYNPLTGEVMEISDRNKQMIAKVVKSDMNNMSTKQLIEMVDSLSNFVENGSVSGIEAAYETYIGEENAASLEREGVVAKTIKLYASKKIGGLQAFSFMSLPELFNRMFGGVKNGINVMTKMGFSDIILGANKARKLVEKIQERYVDKFGNIKGFFDNENIYERGALAFLTRNVIGSEAEIKSEFNRRVDWLFESFERLKSGTAEEQKMAVVYGKVIDKLDIKSRDLEKIYSNADKTNVEAVNWWIEEWSKHYSDLSDVSRSVYNAILGKDTGYTTDRLKMTSKESLNKTTSKDLMDLMERNSSFLINTDAITNTNESGVMIASIRPEVKNTKGRYVSLDFEINNIDSLTGALVDINTAGAIRRLDSFMKSKSFDKIIPNSDDQIILKTRINRYVRRIKNKMPVSSRFMRGFNKIVNTGASLGATLGLGGATQVIKQTVSVAMSTALQTKGNFNIYAGKSFNDWLDTTGASVANRGQESISSIESANKKIQSFSGNFDRTLKALSKATQWQLRLFLSRPDVFVARAAFKSYYEQFLKDNGYDVSKINWDTWSDTIKKEGIEKLNRDAIVYADAMVSRQQNVSDERLAGEALASEDDWVKFLRKVAFPFGSFSINQRARLINDLITIKNRKTASKEDMAIAWSSLFGTLVEQATFQAINYSLGMLWYSIAQGLAGHDDDEEEWEKRKERATQYPLRSLAADVTSPNPLFDDLFIDFYDVILSNMTGPSESEINKAINDEEKLRESLKKDPMTESQINEFKKQYIEDNTYQLSPNYINFEDGKWGMFSIAPDQAMQLYERFKTVSTGTVISDDYGKETTKYLTDKDKRIAQGIFYSLDLPYTVGAGIKEMGQVSNKTYSIIKNRALTENQYETYKQFKKDFKREPQEWEINLIKSTKSANDALGEFDFIKEQGGLSPKQGVEYLNVFKKIGPLNPEDYRMIINGKKADQVIKSILK